MKSLGVAVTELVDRSKFITDSVSTLSECKFTQPTASDFLLRDMSGKTYAMTKVALKQLCSALKVPFDFVRKNPANLNEEIINQYIGAVDEVFQLRTSSVSSDAHVPLMGIVPLGATVVNDSDIYSALERILAQSDYLLSTFEVGNPDGVEHSYRVLSRFVKADPYRVADFEVQVGFSLLSSQYCCTPILLEAVLRNPVTDSFVSVGYGKGPYFKNSYKNIVAADLVAVFEGIISRMMTDLPSYKDKLNFSALDLMTEGEMKDVWSILKERRGLSKGFLLKVEQDLVASYQNVQSLSKWHIASRISDMSKELTEKAMFQHERLAGELLNLKYD